MRQRRGGNQCAVVNLHAVIHFVTLLEPTENGYGVLNRRLVYHDGLETPLQRGVLFDVLPVLVERGRAYAVQLAARQHGLQQVACVHCAVGLARTNYRVQLVDEKDDFAFALADFVQHRFQPFLEFAPELRARDERAHVEGENGLVLEPFGHIAAHYPLRKPFGNSRLTHAGFADEHGVVLGLP